MNPINIFTKESLNMRKSILREEICILKNIYPLLINNKFKYLEYTNY